jgi:hypothetical protein
VLISGVTVTMKVAHVRLCHSRMMFAQAYMRESQEMVFDAHDRAFAFFRGTCTRGIYDSETLFAIGSRTMVERRRQSKRSSSARNASTTVAFCRCAAIIWFSRRPLGLNQWRHNERPCTPASGWEKGQVENQVGLIRERFFTPRLRVKSLDELNAWLLDKCATHAKAHRHPEQADRTIWEVFEEERQHLVPYAGRFDGFHSVPASVSKTCTVRFDSNKYSVLATAVGRPVEVHAYADRIVIRQNGAIVGEHARAFGRGQTVYDPWHYVPVLARKPGALRNGAPFKDWVLPPAMTAIRRKLKGSDDGDRQMVQILSCVPDDGLQAVEAACREALDQGVHSAPIVINILARSRDPAPAALLLTPATLRLTHEPVADCARYDSLRRTSRHGTHPNPRPDGDAEALRNAQRL